MKKILIATSLLLAVTQATAGDCKGVKERVDPFSNKPEKTAQFTIGGMFTKWTIEMEQKEGAATMRWGIAAQGEFNQKLDVGTKLLLRLEDGTILTLGTIEASTPVTQAVSGGGAVNVFSVYYLKFGLSEETLGALSKSVVTDVKIDVPGLKIKNPTLKGRQMEKIKDVSSCFLNK